jgi:hypothetical protein
MLTDAMFNFRSGITGTTDDDRMAMAVRRYSGIDAQERNQSGNFPHSIALKGCPKFMSTMSSGRLDAVRTSGQMTENVTNLDGGMQITTRSGSPESSKIGPDIEDITSWTTRPGGRKAAKNAKRERQVERLARGSEEHAKSLNRIAQGLEEASKRKRSDLLLNISQEDLQLLDSSERERLKNIRAHAPENPSLASGKRCFSDGRYSQKMQRAISTRQDWRFV